MLPTNQNDPRVRILHLKESEKKRTLIGLLAQRVETEIRFLNIVGTCCWDFEHWIPGALSYRGLDCQIPRASAA